MDNKIWEENTPFSANDIHLLTMIRGIKMEKQDKIKQILGNIENTEIFLQESNFIQKPSCDEILNYLKNSKEIVYKKLISIILKKKLKKYPI